MKAIRYAEIWIDSAAAGISAARSIWSSAASWQEALVETIAIEGLLTAQAVAASSKVSSASFARGGSFTTNGPQTIIVGDNPGGREDVTVTPRSSKNFDGPQGSTANFHFYNSSGMEVETFRAKINSGEMDGVMSLLKEKMALR
jgi:hypothetical protein